VRIIVNPDQLRQVAQQLHRASSDLRGASGNIGRTVGGMSLEIRARTNVDERAVAARRQAEALAERAESLARYLEERAEAFQRADGQSVATSAVGGAFAGVLGSIGALLGRNLGGVFSTILSTMGGLLAPAPVNGMAQLLASSPVGSVLGASIEAKDYASMRWGQRFDELERLEREIAALQGRIPEGMTLEDVQTKIADLDKQITDLEGKRDEAEKRAGQWWNKIIPTWPLSGDGDGVPWRSQSDKYEDQVAERAEQIADLQKTRDQLFQNQKDLEALARLQQNHLTLNDLVQQGIPSDGPDKDWSPYIGGCTHYVAQKRLVHPHPGNAYLWNDQAQAAGYEVGVRPIKGSTMVFEPGVLKSHATAGHVAYVEEVALNDDGSYVIKTSEAGTLYDSNGDFISGTHTTPWNREITVLVKDGHVYDTQGNSLGVSFIYDKPT